MTALIAGSARVGSLQQTAVNRILAEMREAQGQGKAVISLMRGEPDFQTPRSIADAAVAALGRGRTSYPDNRGEVGLREAIATKLARDNQLTYDPAREILVTTGATLGLFVVLTALLNVGDEVLVPSPVYDAYQSPVLLAGGRTRPVPADVRDGRYQITLQALEAAVTPATRLLLLNSPWNPVGTVFREDELRVYAAFAERHNLAIVSDEIYEAIVYDGHRHVSPASLSAAARERTIIINSFSKTYAMTGWRVGYCAAPAPLIDAMFLVLQQASRGPATFIQDAAAVAVAGSQDAVREMRDAYTDRRRQVLDALAGVPRVRALAPEGGFFVMVDIAASGLSSDEVRRRLLFDAGVAVVHGAAYGEGGEGMLRVSFASGGDNLSRGLERLRDGLSRL